MSADRDPRGLIEPTLSLHARRRFKERVGLPIRAAKRAAFEALHYGKRLDQLHFAHAARLIDMARKHDAVNPMSSLVRVYKTHAFIFCTLPEGGIRLITVLPYFETPDDVTEELRRSGGTKARRKGFQ